MDISDFHGKRLLFIGDSITDAGRKEDDVRGLGHGYVALIADLLDALYPESKVDVINRGVGGDRVTDLENRWEQDVIQLAPDWVSMSIGINDVWRSFSKQPEEVSQAVPLEKFASTYKHLLDRTKEATSAKLILMETSIIEENPQSAPNHMLQGYNQVIRELASRYNATLVPVNHAFMQAITVRPGVLWSPEAWTTDGVHPRPRGHMLMALTWLRATNLLTED